MKLSDAANQVIDLAGKVRAYYDTELPKWYPNYPLVDAEEEGLPPPPEEKKLRDFLVALPETTLYQLLLIMRLGRGEVEANDLAAYYETLKGSLGNSEQATTQMMVFSVVMAGELLDGLEELRKRGMNVDMLPLQRVKVRKR